MVHPKNIKKWQIANGAGDIFPMEKGTQAALDGTEGTTVPKNALWKAKTI